MKSEVCIDHIGFKELDGFAPVTQGADDTFL